jgi:hypothetical protein
MLPNDNQYKSATQRCLIGNMSLATKKESQSACGGDQKKHKPPAFGKGFYTHYL